MMNVYQRALREATTTLRDSFKCFMSTAVLETARILLHAAGVSDGYVALWERKRLDLTVEALVLQGEWHPLFSDQERKIARTRLAEYRYKLGGHP